jgi:hypothetical protein
VTGFSVSAVVARCLRPHTLLSLGTRTLRLVYAVSLGERLGLKA